jgi:hypothetical protein
MTWFTHLRKRFFTQPPARRPFRRDRMRLHLERLEDRTLLDAGLPAPPVATAPGSNGHFINDLYEVLLSRTPSQGEVDTWTTAMTGGLTPAQMISGFLVSPEYQADLVRGAYLNLLSRAPESGVTSIWVAAMQRGLTGEQFKEGLLASAEYYSDQGQNASAWVTALYNDVLGRLPDSAGLAGWNAALQHGASRQIIAQGFVTSAEGRAQTVSAAYQQLLGRSPEPSALGSVPFTEIPGTLAA